MTTLFFVLLFSNAPAQSSDSTKTKKGVSSLKKVSASSGLSFGGLLRFHIERLHHTQKTYGRFKSAEADSSSPEERTRKNFYLANTILSIFSRFQQLEIQKPEFDDNLLESLEFYDEKIKGGVRWYIRFLKSAEFDSFLNAIPEALFEMNFSKRGLDRPAILALRQPIIEFCDQILQKAESVPLKFRRSYEDLRKRYDDPATPVGGYAALQRALKATVVQTKTPFSGVVRIKTLISETGEVLRARLLKSSDSAEIDQAAIHVIQNAKWRPATFNGAPFKADVFIPLRFWN